MIEWHDHSNNRSLSIVNYYECNAIIHAFKIQLL